MTNSGWRYIAQRVDGEGNLGEFLDFNLPISSPDIEDVLSGHNGFSGTITPEVQRLKGSDGRPILEEWGTAIWAESPDGEIRGGGVVEVISQSGPELSIQCIDISGSMIDLPYLGANFFVNVDPIDIFRHIWTHAQSQPGGNYGVTVDPTRSPVLLGGTLVQRSGFDTEPDVSLGVEDSGMQERPVATSPSRFATNEEWVDRGVAVMKTRGWKGATVREALEKWVNKDQLKEEGKWKALTKQETTIRDKVLDAIGFPPDSPSGTNPAVIPFFYARPQINPPEAGEEADADTGEAPVTWEYDAYKLNWYSNLDLSSDIDDLAAATPFDWHMVHQWYEGEDGPEIRHHIRVGYPRLGRRLTDERFVIGENIKVIPDVERDGAAYANEVLVLGAGEGSAQVIGRAFRPRDGRPRRVATVVAPWISDAPMATSYAQSQLASRSVVEDVTDIVLHDHPHAPMGSVDLGDEILIEGETGWSDLEIWVRVIAKTMSPDDGDSMALTVMRTDRIS